MKETLFVEGKITIAELTRTPGSNNGFADIDRFTTHLLRGDPIFISLEIEYLYLVSRCFDGTPLSALEIFRWQELDGLLSQRVATITGCRSAPVIWGIRGQRL